MRSQGQAYQPGADRPVTVPINNEAISADGEIEVWHVREDGSAEPVKDMAVEEGMVRFAATGFSVYVVLGSGLRQAPLLGDDAGSKPELTITADSGNKVYDANELKVDTYTVAGLREGDTVESVTISGTQTYLGSSDNVPSGAKIVNASGEDVTDQYQITNVNGTLTVTWPDGMVQKELTGFNGDLATYKTTVNPEEYVLTDEGQKYTTIDGGTKMTGNTANGGGAVYMEGGSLTVRNAGSELTGNHAINGGAIYATSGAIGVGGTSARLYFKGDAEVNNNTMNGAQSNVYLDVDSELVINADSLNSSKKIGIYVPGGVNDDQVVKHGDVTGYFGAYVSGDNAKNVVNVFKSDRFDDLKVAYENNRMYWISTGSDGTTAMNVYLGYDSNSVITSSGLGSNAWIGVYVADGEPEPEETPDRVDNPIYADHGVGGRNFGTYTIKETNPTWDSHVFKHWATMETKPTGAGGTELSQEQLSERGYFEYKQNENILFFRGTAEEQNAQGRSKGDMTL